MSGINTATIVGRVGRDPETRYTAHGDAVTNLSIATSYKSGEDEYTEWHKITLWKKIAEIAGEHVRKGDQVGIQGRLQTRKWQDKDGQDRYTTEIVAEKLFLLGKAGGGRREEAQDTGEADEMGARPEKPAKPSGVAAPKKPATMPSAAAAKPAQTQAEMDDDIPF